tara:strand:+ start:6409 stop:6801 length:393 start_codon:yes stop_codon:yes gene_type:complete
MLEAMECMHDYLLNDNLNGDLDPNFYTIVEREVPIEDYIKRSLVAYLSRNGVDGYGQIKVLDPYAVFGNRTEEVLEYNIEHKVLPICTYGGRFGAYKGFNVGDIKDESLRKACYDATKNNPTYKHAMTSW